MNLVVSYVMLITFAHECYLACIHFVKPVLLRQFYVVAPVYQTLPQETYPLLLNLVESIEENPGSSELKGSFSN